MAGAMPRRRRFVRPIVTAVLPHGSGTPHRRPGPRRKTQKGSQACNCATSRKSLIDTGKSHLRPPMTAIMTAPKLNSSQSGWNLYRLSAGG